MVTVVVVCVTVNPAPFRSLVAAAAVSPVTFGTLTIGGAWAITRLIVEFAGTDPVLLWLITVPGVWLLDCVVVVTLTLSGLRFDLASASVSPTTLGTLTGGGPREMNRVNE